eukprot:3627865-Amphidinium_carterae.1
MASQVDFQYYYLCVLFLPKTAIYEDSNASPTADYAWGMKWIFSKQFCPTTAHHGGVGRCSYHPHLLCQFAWLFTLETFLAFSCSRKSTLPR